MRTEAIALDRSIETVERTRSSLAPEIVADFEATYRAHSEAVFRYLRVRCPSDDEALELAAITFERAFRAVVRDPATPIGLGWLLRTARNATIDVARRRRTVGILTQLLPRNQHDAPSPEAGVIAAEEATIVRLAVAGLPSAQRDAIALRFTTDLTVRQISELIGKGEAATQKLISRGLTRLKEVLDGRN